MGEEYIFVSYSHKDKRAVLREISKREKLGQQFWYDKSIKAGDDWAETIGKKLEESSSVLYFESKKSKKSENCQRELAFAKDNNIPVETVKVKSKGLLTVLLIVFVIVAIVGFALSQLIGTVPNVIGENTITGIQTIVDSGFECNTNYDYSEEYPMGCVMEQDKIGNTFSFIPVTLTQSLGSDKDLALMPDTVGSNISVGVSMLVESGFTRFTVEAGMLEENTFGEIIEQSAPAGFMISKGNIINLTVAKDESPLQFEYDGYLVTLEDGVTFDLAGLEDFGLTEAELKLFEENSHHGIWNPDDFENVWLPAQNEKVIIENPDSCYGWVIVRDTQLNADNLFVGYSEIYVCPGVTVTVTGKVKDHDSFSDFYVAKGGTLIFEDEVDGGIYLVNDGEALFKKDVSGGADGVLIANRGNVSTLGSFNDGVDVWSFYESTLSGTDNTGGTVHDYTLAEQLDATNWYEGCSGTNGVAITLGKLKTYESYDQSHLGSENGAYALTPVITPEDYEDTYQTPFYSNAYLFLCDYTLDKSRQGRGQSWMLIAAPRVTLTIGDNNLHAHIVCEKDSTVIINSNLKGYYPYCPWFIIDGTLILNGDYVWKYGTTPIYVSNRGDFVINGEFGGERTYVYNYKGSTMTGDPLEGSYVTNLDFVPDYVTYGNDSGTALNYDEEFLRQMGYRWKYDEQEKYEKYKDTVYTGE